MAVLGWIALLVLLAALCLLVLWLIGFLSVTDVFVSTKSPKDTRAFRRVLAIFPHPDDEAVSCGGTLHRFAAEGRQVALALLTRGERGTPDAHVSERLGAIRACEAQAVAKKLCVRLIQADFGDGELCQSKQLLAAYITALIEREAPDLLITYDLAGFYGHPDHIACAEVVTKVRAASFPQLPLWYVTFPRLILAAARLPKHLAPTDAAHVRQARPTLKLFLGRSVTAKIAAWYTYQSQRAALTKGLMRLLPIWLFLSMMLFEYFAEAGEDAG